MESGDVYDLLDAYEYSERIVSDYTDVISELDERRRQLVAAVTSQQEVLRATDEFFDFMEKRFMPDIAIRLSADSVEKYRDEISELVQKARRRPAAFKADAERDLRRVAPELMLNPAVSVLLSILDGIDARVHNAAAVMLPAMRQALNSFTRRADIIMRQLSYSDSAMNDRLQRVCERFRAASVETRETALANAGMAMATLSVGFPDTDAIRLLAPRRAHDVNAMLDDVGDVDLGMRQRLFVQSAVDLAFTFTNDRQRDYVVQALCDDGRVRTRDLPIANARDLLMSAHAIELGALRGSEWAFRVEPLSERVRTEYFDSTDEFLIELVTGQSHAE